MSARVSNNHIVYSVHLVPELTSASFLVPQDYAVRVCKEFCLLGKLYFIVQLSGPNDLFVYLLCTGSRGVSVIFSSGDAGVGDGDADPATQQCFSNDGKNKTIFLPQFPASCPLCVIHVRYCISPYNFSSIVLCEQRHYSRWDSGNSGDRGAILGWGFQQLRKLDPPIASPLY